MHMASWPVPFAIIGARIGIGFGFDIEWRRLAGESAPASSAPDRTWLRAKRNPDGCGRQTIRCLPCTWT